LDKFAAIKVFCRVVELASFTQAADSLAMGKTTVSKLVAEVEQELKVKLLMRTTRTVRPTPEGEIHYARTMQWLRKLEDIDTGFAEYHATPHGKVRVALSSWVASEVVIPALRDFHDRYPGIQIELNVSDRPSHMILDNVDCAVRSGTAPDMAVARPLGQTYFIAAATPDYLAAYGMPRDPMELNENHHLVGHQFAASGRSVPFRFRRIHEEVEIAGDWFVSVNDGNAHLSAGLNGLGVLTAFEWKLRPYLADGRLVRVLEDWRSAEYPFCLVYLPNEHRNQRVQIVMDWITELFASFESGTGL
jgi:DNA-binding transcriptional LysR family regulator